MWDQSWPLSSERAAYQLPVWNTVSCTRPTEGSPVLEVLAPVGFTISFWK